MDSILNKINMKCTFSTKTKYLWNKPLDGKIYKILQGTCDLSGKGCKTAEEWKESHSEKIEIIKIKCNSNR
ncbi:MAG: hypothetical protein IMZ60_00030 [Actinobacteria bacterium]|nr:hypothetical protein [Actinomycetota bacterium]